MIYSATKDGFFDLRKLTLRNLIDFVKRQCAAAYASYYEVGFRNAPKRCFSGKSTHGIKKQPA